MVNLLHVVPFVVVRVDNGVELKWRRTLSEFKRGTKKVVRCMASHKEKGMLLNGG